MEYVPNFHNLLKKVLPWSRKILSIVAQLSGIATIIALGVVIKINFLSDAEVKCSGLAKYKVGKVAVYQGELINLSSSHAERVTVKGKFNSEVLKVDVDTSDIVEPLTTNGKKGSVEFMLKRLSKGNKCLFSIIVTQQSEITEQLYVSWGKNGSLKLSLQQADPKIQKAFELAGDLSLKARQKWFENNAKNIR